MADGVDVGLVAAVVGVAVLDRQRGRCSDVIDRQRGRCPDVLAAAAATTAISSRMASAANSICEQAATAPSSTPASTKGWVLPRATPAPASRSRRPRLPSGALVRRPQHVRLNGRSFHQSVLWAETTDWSLMCTQTMVVSLDSHVQWQCPKPIVQVGPLAVRLLVAGAPPPPLSDCERGRRERRKASAAAPPGTASRGRMPSASWQGFCGLLRVTPRPWPPSRTTYSPNSACAPLILQSPRRSHRMTSRCVQHPECCHCLGPALADVFHNV